MINAWKFLSDLRSELAVSAGTDVFKGWDEAEAKPAEVPLVSSRGLDDAMTITLLTADWTIEEVAPHFADGELVKRSTMSPGEAGLMLKRVVLRRVYGNRQRDWPEKPEWARNNALRELLTQAAVIFADELGHATAREAINTLEKRAVEEGGLSKGYSYACLANPIAGDGLAEDLDVWLIAMSLPENLLALIRGLSCLPDDHRGPALVALMRYVAQVWRPDDGSFARLVNFVTERYA